MMNASRLLVPDALVAALLLGGVGLHAQQTPPYAGTLWDLPSNLLSSTDPSSFRSITYLGLLERHMLIFEDNAYIGMTEPVHVFNVSFGRRDIEFQFYPEYGGEDAALEEAERYADIFGRMPWAIMSLVREVEFQKDGPRSASGFPIWWPRPESAGTMSIHTDHAFEQAVRRGFMEEVFLHEGVHVSLEHEHRETPEWLAAQEADPTFISTYARDNPLREDFAETVPAWFAVRFRPELLSMRDYEAILDAIPNRLAYLDRQNFDMSPYRRVAPVPALPLVGVLLLALFLMLAGRRVVAL